MPLPLARLSRGRGGAPGRSGNMAEAEGESLESWLSEYRGRGGTARPL